jgi:hypothetical protein
MERARAYHFKKHMLLQVLDTLKVAADGRMEYEEMRALLGQVVACASIVFYRQMWHEECGRCRARRIV